ncbi:MAG: hydroxymethylpyrimidine/phosphomethylpyrimidine kinase [Pyrinomonadaceae bacterium]|nr:hydroxymethylpyrimidine/phosphomethylpyrimidine kinase [Pyrinomonadaceae bacterium]
MAPSAGNSLPVALTIAGIDPSGGAGVIADVRTFAAFGCFATAAITSLTFQNTTGVFGALHQTPETVRAQVMPIIKDFNVSCAKTGMLPTREVIAEVARLFRETSLPAPVVDPVMRATSGDDLINDDAVSCLVADLFPLALVVTPNIPEAERLTGLAITDESGMRKAARIIREMGARAVLVKGGHLASKPKALTRRHETQGEGKTAALWDKKVDRMPAIQGEAIDVLDNEGRVTTFRAALIAGGEVHGSGCTLSAAIAACLGNGQNLEEAIQTAKSFVTESIRRSPRLGHGARPLYNDTRHLTSGT